MKKFSRTDSYIYGIFLWIVEKPRNLANLFIYFYLLSYFFVKKIPLSRRVEYVMEGSMDQ